MSRNTKKSKFRLVLKWLLEIRLIKGNIGSWRQPLVSSSGDLLSFDYSGMHAKFT